MTAVCEIDGLVKMRTHGKGRTACAVKLADKKARWAARNPEKARANRKSRSPHRLTKFDQSTMTGECPVCGTVGVVPKGRGFMCRTRAEQLWKVQQEAPQERCSECRKNYLRADGKCPYCSDREHLDWSVGIRAEQDAADLMQMVQDRRGDGMGLLVRAKTDNPSSVEGEYVSNPSLKTIGAGVPAGRRPEGFIRDWWAENAHLVEGN